MKKYKLNVMIFACIVFSLMSCDKNILDKVPMDKYSEDLIWSDINLADSYLKDCYVTSKTGYATMMLAGVTDECMFLFIKNTDNYLLGQINADNSLPWNTTGGYSFDYCSWPLFKVVQEINVFISNIDKVPDAYKEEEKVGIKAKTDVLKGEALFLRAFVYTQMCRTYGGLPIFSEPNKLGSDFSSVTRGTFKETVDFIVADCDEAVNLLKLKSEMEMGRANKEAALALKSRILLFAASDLTADGTAESELVGYNNPDRTALWTAAKNAAKEVMDLGTCQLADFGAPDKESVAKKYFEFFKAYDLSNKEVIWGKMYLKDKGVINERNLRNANNGNECYGSHSPTQNFVDAYEMEDGSKFSDHFFIDDDGFYKNKSTTFKNENPYYNREPRFYGSILYDSAVWQPRQTSALQAIDPVGIYDRRTRRIVNADGTVTNKYGIDTRNGPVQAWNGTYTGYIPKKMLDDKTYGYYEKNQNVWIEFRYAEIIMNYAEACLGLGDTETAATYINMIRNRAALPNFVGDITEALRYERKIEFYQEDKRWFDVRRWKILDQVLTDALGMDILEVTQGDKITTTWQQIFVQKRGPASKKMYWIPIPTDEIKKAPQLVQNPGY